MIELGRCHAVNAWEQRKLKDLIIKGGSGGTPNSRIKKYYIGNIPFLNISDISTRNIQDSEKHISKQGMESCSAWLVPAGSISLAMYASVGKVGVLMKPMATSQAFYNLCFNDESLRNYVYSRLEKAQIYSEWNPYISTGTQSNLNAKKVLNFILEIPEPEEVEQIGKLFTILDALIDAEKRKLDLLKQKKKALLHQIFEQKLRFKGYNNPWERRKGSDIIHVRKETNSKPLTDTVDIELENLIEGGGLQGDISLRTSSTSVFREHDTLFGRLRPYLRKFWLADISGVKSGEIWALFSPTLKSEFLYALTQSAQFLNPALQTAGTKMPRAEWKAIAEACFTIPETDEQEKIGQLFRQLEHLTAVETRKIDLLSVKKKALLQKMFV